MQDNYQDHLKKLTGWRDGVPDEVLSPPPGSLASIREWEERRARIKRVWLLITKHRAALAALLSALALGWYFRFDVIPSPINQSLVIQVDRLSGTVTLRAVDFVDQTRPQLIGSGAK